MKISKIKKRTEILKLVGGRGSAHNQARRNCEALMNQKQHIRSFIIKLHDRDQDGC